MFVFVLIYVFFRMTPRAYTILKFNRASRSLLRHLPVDKQPGNQAIRQVWACPIARLHPSMHSWTQSVQQGNQANRAQQSIHQQGKQGNQAKVPAGQSTQSDCPVARLGAPSSCEAWLASRCCQHLWQLFIAPDRRCCPVGQYSRIMLDWRRCPVAPD